MPSKKESWATRATIYHLDRGRWLETVIVTPATPGAGLVTGATHLVREESTIARLNELHALTNLPEFIGTSGSGPQPAVETMARFFSTAGPRFIARARAALALVGG